MKEGESKNELEILRPCLALKFAFAESTQGGR